MTNETALLYGQQGLAPRLMLVGLGERDLLTTEKIRRAAATVARRARTLKLQSAAFSLPTLPDTTIREVARTVAEGAGLGLYSFDRHKSATEDQQLETFWLVADEGALEEATGAPKWVPGSLRVPRWPVTSPTSPPTWPPRSISQRGPARSPQSTVWS